MEIPWQEMDQQTLMRLLSELVTRDGTDYGRVEVSTDAKVNKVLSQLKSGSAVLLWNEETESASLVSREALQQEQRELERLSKRAGIGSETLAEIGDDEK